MHKHKLIELQKIVNEKIGALKEEVEIGTNVKLNPLYIVYSWSAKMKYNFSNALQELFNQY